MLVVLSLRRRGCLALLWIEKVDLHVQTNTPNHIDALISMTILFGGLLDSMGGLRSKGNMNHGSCLNIFTLGVWFCGYVMEIIMRF